MLDTGLPLRKIIIGGIAALVLFFGLFYLIHLLTTGSITVTTGSRSGIVSLKPLNAAPDSTNVTSAPHSLSRRVKPGQYLISAASGSSRGLGTSKVVTVKARKSASYTINPPRIATAEPVLPADASSLSADSQQLFYVTSADTLDHLDGSNVVQTSYGNLVNIKAAVWASASLGVIQTVDNHLYMISGGAVQQLQLPVTIPAAATSNIDLSRDGTLVFTDGGDIYSGKIGQTYKHIYKSDDDKVRVAAGGKYTAIVEALDESKEAEGNDQVVVIDSHGKKVVKAMGAQQAAWSPSGKYLFVAEEDGGNHIYDSSLNLVRDLVSTPFGAFTWITDDQFAYGLGSGLWLYSISGGQGVGVSNMNGDEVRAIAPSSDSSYLYVATDHAGQEDTGQISRVGLKNQPVPSYLQSLQVFLPETVGVCSLSYINFTTPVIAVNYPALETTSDLCLRAAKGSLQNYDVDPGKFQFTVTAQDQQSGE